jgi:uncharacterized membrane protein YccC
VPWQGPGWTEVRASVLYCCVLALAATLAYSIAIQGLARIHSVSGVSDLIGGLWTMIATLFVCHIRYRQTMKAAVTRVVGTSVSFVLCLIYLVFLPFHLWAMALLIGLSALAVMLIGRPGDAIVAGIATAVVLVVAEASPHDAWQEPILRFVDTVIGVAVGLLAGWISARIVPDEAGQAASPQQ